ncbi:MAG: hypothetical protein F6K00_02555 [Leptolyngbya sp. SIOISBB]|nr:hypothetical protein [Leptolyngbya sp. SIOISBB]
MYSPELLAFWQYRIIPDSIDGWLRLIVLMFPMYFVSTKSVRVQKKAMEAIKRQQEEAMNGVEENSESSFLLAGSNVLLSAGLFVLVMIFWQVTDWTGIELVSLPFLLGYLAIVAVSVVFIFRFDEHST